MRAWRIIGKYKIYDDDGNISHTEIAITTTSGQQASITERVIGDHTKKNDEELIALVCDAFFKSEYADRAMAESVQKIEELEVNLKEGQRLRQEMQEQLEFTAGKLAQVDDALERSEVQFTKVEELIKMTTGTVNELIANMMGGMDDENITEED